jgi:hypothetical protein
MLLKLKNSQERKYPAFILYLQEPITLGESSKLAQSPIRIER